VGEPEQVSLSGPGGFGATARGLLTPIILILGLGFGVSIYFFSETAAQARAQHDRIEMMIGRMADGIEVQNWLLSLPQDKRPRLLRPYSANRFIESEREQQR
jgi:hypothetical protein